LGDIAKIVSKNNQKNEATILPYKNKENNYRWFPSGWKYGVHHMIFFVHIGEQYLDTKNH
jgi:hypothetical protein